MEQSVGIVSVEHKEMARLVLVRIATVENGAAVADFLKRYVHPGAVGKAVAGHRAGILAIAEMGAQRTHHVTIGRTAAAGLSVYHVHGDAHCLAQARHGHVGRLVAAALVAVVGGHAVPVEADSVEVARQLQHVLGHRFGDMEHLLRVVGVGR